MKKLVIVIALMICFTTVGQDHMYSTNKGRSTIGMSFSKTGPVKGENNKIKGLFNSKNGQLVFMAMAKDMSFDNAMISGFFKENVLGMYPDGKVIFKGTLLNFNNNVRKEEYMLTGNLTVLEHTIPIKQPCKFKLKGSDFLLNISAIKPFHDVFIEERSGGGKKKIVKLNFDFILSKGAL